MTSQMKMLKLGWKRSSRKFRIMLVVWAILFVPVVCFALWLTARSLMYGIILAGAWPADEVGACAGDAACVWSAIFTGGRPVLLGFLWFLAIVVGFVISLRLRPDPGTARAIKARLRAQRTVKDQLIGLITGWVLVVTTLLSVAVLLLVPLGAGVTAFATWSEERRDACSADPGCVISTIPENAMPVWMAFAWVAIIAIALVVCWQPARWWMPDAKGRKRVKLRVFTTPFWIRIHALAAAFFSLAISYGVYKRGNDVYAIEYLWVVLAALTVAVAATAAQRRYGSITPDDVKTSLAVTFSGPVGIFTRRWWALQRELHPGGSVKEEAQND